MKHWSDSVVLWIVTIAVALGFVLGAAWARWLEPPVQVFDRQVPAVTAQTVAPAVPAEVEP